MNLSLAAAPGSVPEDRLHDRVRALIATVVVDDRIPVAPADPVGGGSPCAVEDCPRPRRFNAFCGYHKASGATPADRRSAAGTRHNPTQDRSYWTLAGYRSRCGGTSPSGS